MIYIGMLAVNTDKKQIKKHSTFASIAVERKGVRA